LLYSGAAEFLAGTTAFIRRAITAGNPILVVVSRPKIDLLRRELGREAEQVSFADMAVVGDNPARIIAAWHGFAQAHPGAAQLWGIGEPVYPSRSPVEVAECQLHEALLNVAFEASVPLWLLCPYDLEVLAADVIDEARRTHPYLVRGEDHQASSSFQPVDLTEPFARSLPAAPAGADSLSFDIEGLRAVREFGARHASQAGLDEQAAAEVVIAVSEVATNSVQHGGGQGLLRAWRDGRSLVCEVCDHGHITSPLVGRLRPGRGNTAGAGLFLANQLCDLVQIHSSPGGTVVRLYREP
jgi:anti-sigma regulatory factor (Ser/Thr protein kinase)